MEKERTHEITYLFDPMASKDARDIREIGDGIRKINHIIANSGRADEKVADAGDELERLSEKLNNDRLLMERAGLEDNDIRQLHGSIEISKVAAKGIKARDAIMTEYGDRANVRIDLLTMLAVDFNMMMDVTQKGEIYGLSSMQQIMSTELFSSEKLRTYVEGTKAAARFTAIGTTELIRLLTDDDPVLMKYGQEAIQQSVFMAQSAVCMKRDA